MSLQLLFDALALGGIYAIAALGIATVIAENACGLTMPKSIPASS